MKLSSENFIEEYTIYILRKQDVIYLKVPRTLFHKFHMRGDVSTLLISMLSTFSRLHRSTLFQSVFHYWELYKQFEYRIAISRFKTSSPRNETGRANSIFRIELSTRSDYLASILQCGWRGTLRNARSFTSVLETNGTEYCVTESSYASTNSSPSIHSIWPMFARGIDHACGSTCEIDALKAFQKYQLYSAAWLLFLSIKPPRIARD